jgi:hypothetical protein
MPHVLTFLAIIAATIALADLLLGALAMFGRRPESKDPLWVAVLVSVALVSLWLRLREWRR